MRDIIKFIGFSLTGLVMMRALDDGPKVIYISAMNFSQRLDYIFLSVIGSVLIYVGYMIYVSGLRTAEELKKSKEKMNEVIQISDRCKNLIDGML